MWLLSFFTDMKIVGVGVKLAHLWHVSIIGKYFVGERLPSDVRGENSKWELMRPRHERVANGKFPCGLCWKLKAVRGGVEVEGEAGKREEEGGGNLRRGEFPLPSHPHAFQTSPDRQSWAQCPVWLPQFSPKWYQIRASHWFSNINLQPPCDFDQRYKC